MIGCKCPVCTSSNPKNKRMRTSVIIRDEEKGILIDTTPELRLQCIANEVERVDSVLFTHGHADHIFGLDDIRRFNELQGGSISCFGSADTLAIIRQAFEYIFIPTQEGGGKPKIELFEVKEAFYTSAVDVTPVPVMHGCLPVYGYRIGRLAYITDCSFIPDRSMELLDGLDILILGALRKQPHETHFNLEQAVAKAEEINARETYFVHMSHGLEHESTNLELPSGIQLAYDGLSIDFSL